MTTGTRNSNSVIEGLDTHSEGVGGRQDNTNTPQWGGGYLDVYPKSAKAFYQKMLADNRIDDLRSHGLADYWIEIAESIGYDNFVCMWQILDKKNNHMNCKDSSRIRVPFFSQFLKFQRNKYILFLRESGKKTSHIQYLLKKELCENLTVVHILRIIKKHTIKK